MTDCIFELQKAIYSTLDEDATLGALIDGVYQHVPEEAAFPYVVIDIGSAADWSTKTTGGFEISFTVNAFCRDRGSKTCLSIINRIYELLHDADLTLTGCDLVNMRSVSINAVLQRDGLTYVGINDYIAKVQII